MKVCSREEPEVPHPLQAQVPPEAGSGLRVTWVPVVAATLAVWVLVPLTEVYAVIAVALQTAGGGGGGGGGVEEDPPPPPHPASAMSAAVAARFVSRRRAGEWVFIWGFVPAGRSLANVCVRVRTGVDTRNGLSCAEIGERCGFLAEPCLICMARIDARLVKIAFITGSSRRAHGRSVLGKGWRQASVVYTLCG